LTLFQHPSVQAFRGKIVISDSCNPPSPFSKQKKEEENCTCRSLGQWLRFGLFLPSFSNALHLKNMLALREQNIATYYLLKLKSHK